MFVLIGAYIATALGDGQLDVELGILAAECGNYQIRVQNLDILVCLNVRSMYDSFAFVFNVCSLGFIGLAAVLDGEALDVHDDLRHIFLDAGHTAELMQHAFNLDLAHRGAGQRGKHDSAQRIAKGDTVASFQGLYCESAILLVF